MLGIDWPMMLDEVKIVLAWAGVCLCIAGMSGIMYIAFL